MLQIDFLERILLECRLGGIQTAVDTAGHVPFEYFKRVMPCTDIFLYDVKCIDSEKHKKYTGVDNRQILENAEYLKQSEIPHTFRTPLIPSITDTEENLSAIERIVKGSAWERLDYNPLAGAKYASVGRKFNL